MRNLEEDKLIEYAIDGVDQAWSEIYRRYYGRVKRVVAWQKWGFRPAEVEEVTQEVFLELIKALPNFRQEASLATFLTRLTKNKCISILRRKGAQKRAKEEFGFVFEEKKSDDDDERFLHVESTMGNPEEELVFDEDSLELMTSLQQLSAECRDIIKKRYYDDLSYKEICDELNLPLGTVCSRLKRCLLRLKEIYVEKFG
ncbi:MAG: sigma-70 family RNA polymerase sigma factor [Firmicutes bacterium]|nr:sigma-70 family RNA polymerase sigma factor [Bacillota bacterium]